MATDDEWLKDTLVSKWDFVDNTATQLIEMGLEAGFAVIFKQSFEENITFFERWKKMNMILWSLLII